MTTISNALQAVRQRISQAATEAGRPVAGIQLLAVSKTFPASAVRLAYTAGQRAFGESYVQEAMDKVEALSDLPLKWHFVGPLQSNKTRPIAESFSWVHSLDRARIADRLSAGRPSNLPDLQVCLQVNVSGESSKSGVAPEDLLSLARYVQALPRLKLRGLMAIPEPSDNPVDQRLAFAHLRQLLEQLNAQGFQLDTLSMGMSDDLEAAIAEGATIVRVGSAIFGEREKL
ncbi:MAG: YggS family pyridoxal phosphate-dependent enzyme [Gammaproteobacteria bacterium]|nr:YggS family pyridoxal phosphate-dependent enzyme [Gammaproteobacteria bacterium]MBU1978093.1 YggS family pyridoxal phosphate-dependent enzyme [Gammaproteobacteria bacterium]